MKKIIQQLIIITLFASFTSCYAPQAVIRVKPVETNTTWEKGKEYVSYQLGNYQVNSSYHGYNENYLIFDIEVVNIDGEDILVAPESIKLISGTWNNSTQQTDYNSIPIKALDPELQLLNVDLAQSKAEAQSKNAQVATAAIIVAALPLSIAAAIADGNSNYVENRVSNSELVDASVNIALGATAVNGVVQDGKIISLNDDRYTWQESSLRKTTLSAGYSIRGLVFFPKPDLSTRKIRMEIPIGDDKISIDYNILLFYPDGYQPTK